MARMPQLPMVMASCLVLSEEVVRCLSYLLLLVDEEIRVGVRVHGCGCWDVLGPIWVQKSHGNVLGSTYDIKNYFY